MMDSNSARPMLDRDPRVKSCQGIPMEAKRLEVPASQIEAYFQRLAEAIHGIPAHFVFNAGEMGHQEWSDRTEKLCSVPMTHATNRVGICVPRTGKRITLLACIGADGSYLRPLIIIPRKTYVEDLA
jgi:hypothetical protein